MHFMRFVYYRLGLVFAFSMLLLLFQSMYWTCYVQYMHVTLL